MEKSRRKQEVKDKRCQYPGGGIRTQSENPQPTQAVSSRKHICNTHKRTKTHTHASTQLQLSIVKTSMEFTLLIHCFFPKTLPLFTPRPAGSGRLFFCLRSIFPVLSFFVTFSHCTRSLSAATSAHFSGLCKASVCYSGLVTFSAV